MDDYLPSRTEKQRAYHPIRHFSRKGTRIKISAQRRLSIQSLRPGLVCISDDICLGLPFRKISVSRKRPASRHRNNHLATYTNLFWAKSTIRTIIPTHAAMFKSENNEVVKYPTNCDETSNTNTSNHFDYITFHNEPAEVRYTLTLLRHPPRQYLHPVSQSSQNLLCASNTPHPQGTRKRRPAPDARDLSR